MNPAEVMYVGSKFDKPKEIVGLKTHMISSVAWCQDMEGYTPTSTCPFLLGTSKGSLFEAEVVNGEVKNVKLVSYLIWRRWMELKRMLIVLCCDRFMTLGKERRLLSPD